MTHRTRIAALAIVGLIAGTSVAHAGGIKFPSITPKPDPIYIDIGPIIPKLPIKPIILDDGVGSNPKSPGDEQPLAAPAMRLALDCIVDDTRSPTGDFWVRNTGDEALPANLKVSFRVRSTGDHGAFLLPHAVPIGGKINIAGLLHDAKANAPCIAHIIM